MYTFVLGPLVWISFGVLVLGSGFQIFRFLHLTRKAGLSPVRTMSRKAENRPRPPFPNRLRLLFQHIRHTIIAVHPVTVTISLLFHLCLLIVPLFLIGHNALIMQALGIRLPLIPDAMADLLTVVVLVCCVFFFFRRFLLARVRAITSLYDYLVLAMATVPFLSGFLAYHQMLDLDYRTVMIVHMLSGELMIMAIPFTKLTHMIFFFMNRFMIVNEHTLGKGSRVW